MTRPYLITAPPYNEKSAGQSVMHKMCHELNQLGYEAYLVMMQNANWPKDMPITNPLWQTPVAPINKNLVQDSIVVYPEIVTGNPLSAPRVVRYLLNKEAQFGQGPIKRSPSDFILIYSNLFGNGHAKLHIPHYSFELFNEFNAVPFNERKITAWYDGKGARYGEIKPIEGALAITRTWPEDRKKLAEILKQTKFLFTWDSNTSLVTEAVMCGAVPVFLRLDPWTLDDFTIKSELGPPAGCALSAENEEIYRAIHTRKVALSRIRNQILNYRNELNLFVESSQNHFDKIIT